MLVFVLLTYYLIRDEDMGIWKFDPLISPSPTPHHSALDWTVVDPN